jgi:Sigma-70, region 4
MSTAAGLGGGATLGGTSVAPPPVFPLPKPAPTATTDSREHSERPVDARHCARLPPLIATLPSPDREIVLLRVVAGVSIPDIVAVLGVTPAAVRLAQYQALSALQPAATANGPLLAPRQRVVLLPHTRTEPTDIRPNNRHAGRGKGMNQDDSLRQHPSQSDGTTRTIAVSVQWHDAELAMKVARHSFERWLVAGHKDTPSPATTHAYHTHTALHEAARAITMLIETFRAEATALITTPALSTDIPTQRR